MNDTDLKQKLYFNLEKELKDGKLSKVWFNPQPETETMGKRRLTRSLDVKLKVPDNHHEIYNKLDIKIEILGFKTKQKEENQTITTGWLFWKKTTKKKVYSLKTELGLNLAIFNKGLKTDKANKIQAIIDQDWITSYVNPKIDKYISKKLEAEAHTEDDAWEYIYKQAYEEILEQLRVLGAQLQQAMK